MPAMQETRVWSLGWEDPLATHSSTLAWKIPFMEKPGRLQSMGSQRIRHYWATSRHFKVPRASQVALMVKILPVQSKGQEDPLEKEIATHSRIFAWEIPWTKEPGGLLSMGLQRVKIWLSDWAAVVPGPLIGFSASKVSSLQIFLYANCCRVIVLKLKFTNFLLCRWVWSLWDFNDSYVSE